jgi:CDP-diacylglycerol--serine O-phosphatidyltransferase
MLRHLPNVITLLNLLCGAISICFSLHFEHLPAAGLMILIAAVFDLFDGMIARALKVDGAMGKELDSLADVVSFGVAPSAIAFALMLRIQAFEWWFIVVFINALFAAYRLARFNTSTNQKHGFIGLPSPANGLLWASIALIEGNYLVDSVLKAILWTVASGVFMVANIPMIAFKFDGHTWKNNQDRYTLIAAILIGCIVCVGMEFENLFPFALAMCLLVGLSLYAVISLLFNLIKRGI